MNFFSAFFSCLWLSLVGSIALFAYDANDMDQQSYGNHQDKSTQNNPMQAGYNAPAKLHLQSDRSYTVYLDGSFTYWQATQENMELGVTGDTSSASDAIDGSLVNMDFDFKPGFQFGIGAQFEPDNWDVYVQYTWFRDSTSKSLALDSTNLLNALYPAWQIPDSALPAYFQGYEKWKVYMDLLDVELGRACFVGRRQIVRSFIGLRAPWIRQSVSVSYLEHTVDPTKSTFVDQSSHSWGIGPRAGVQIDWLLGYGWMLCGKGNADIIYTRYTTLNFLQQSTILNGQLEAGSRYSYTQPDLGYLRAHLDYALGFNWGRYFLEDKLHLNLVFDYTFQVFFDQNMFRNFLDDQALGKSISPNGNLYIQGLTIACRVAF